MVERILTLTAEGYTDAKIARALTEGGFRAARSREGIPKNFVRNVRRERGVSSPFETLKGRKKPEGSWTVPGLARELGGETEPDLQAHARRRARRRAASEDRPLSRRRRPRAGRRPPEAARRKRQDVKEQRDRACATTRLRWGSKHVGRETPAETSPPRRPSRRHRRAHWGAVPGAVARRA